MVMSEQENLKTVQRFYNGASDGDIARLWSKLMTDDVDWIGSSIRRHGREQVVQLGKETLAALEFQEFQPDEFIVGRDTVVVLGHERCLVRATGRVVNANWAQIFTLRNGMICQFREYTDTAAWEAGVSEK
jgi:uncharacterized protein